MKNQIEELNNYCLLMVGLEKFVELVVLVMQQKVVVGKPATNRGAQRANN